MELRIDPVRGGATAFFPAAPATEIGFFIPAGSCSTLRRYKLRLYITRESRCRKALGTGDGCGRVKLEFNRLPGVSRGKRNRFMYSFRFVFALLRQLSDILFLGAALSVLKFSL